MTSEDLGGGLLKAVVFALQWAFMGASLYAIGRLLVVGRVMINPFKNGWGSLRAYYSVAAPTARMQSTSALIGAVRYRNLVSIGFGPDALCLGRSFLGTRYVSIPYPAIAIEHPPRRVTILRIPLTLDGSFRVPAAGVDFTLQPDQAKALIEVLARHAPTGGGPARL